MPSRPLDVQALAPPALAWRRPVWLWAPVAFAISVAWPALFLRSEGGLAQFAAITTGVAFVLAVVALALGYAIGRPPLQRRHVVAAMVIAAALCALLSPLAFIWLIGAVTETEYGGQAPGPEIAGLSPDMAWALAPLALAVGAPASVFAGLALALIGFEKRKARPAPPQIEAGSTSDG
jgi:hypothetical protein